MSHTFRISIVDTNNRRESDLRPIQLVDVQAKKKKLFMDEAIAKTQFGLFNYILIILSGIILITVTNETLNLCYILPVAECDLGLSTSRKGILASSPYLGMILSSHLWGFLADTNGRKSVIQPSLLFAFLISVTSSFVQNFYLFTVLRFFNGFFISGCSATIFAYLSEFHSNQNKTRAIMGASVIFAICIAMAPLLAWAVINQNWSFYIPFIDIVYKPWRLYIVVGSAFGFLAFVILCFLPESPKFVLGTQGKQLEAYEILQKMNRINNGKGSPLEPFELHEETESIENRRRIEESKSSRFPFLKSVWIQTEPIFKSYLGPTALLCYIQFSIYSVTNGLAMFLPEILNRMATNTNDYFHDRAMMCDVIHLKTQLNQTINVDSQKVCVDKLEIETLEQGFSGEASYIATSVLITLIIDKYVGKFPILFVILVGTGISGTLCILHNIPILQVVPFVIHTELSGLAGNILNAAAVEIYPTNLRGMAICINLMFARAGGVVGSNVSSLLLESHCQVLFGVSGSLLIVAGILSYFIPKIHEKMEDVTETRNEPRASVFSGRFN